MEYRRNEYDWCVINNIIEDNQWTILWHVDDLKTSHVESAIIYIVLSCICAEYGRIEKMTITQGKVHKYFSMNIDYSSPDKVIFLMIDYIVNMIDNIPEDMKVESSTPDANHLF